MIAKGTTHNNGGRLAVYMTTAKKGEQAELWQLRGFASDNIKEAFRDVHTMAEGTHCENPFFHVQVRNPEGENLTREQWERVADRIESKLGYSDQPRAIAFHKDLATGHEHMHVAWSRIDDQTMTVRELPFFKMRLKEVSRELEIELGLTRVKNERETAVRAPTRDQDEQARRLGIDIREVRQTIRDCWERADNGRSFVAALADNGLVLAQGDRRDFVVMDEGGGTHALGKRLLGNTAGEIRERLADLDRAQLPTVAKAREEIERTLNGERDEIGWEDKLAAAAIEKEKIQGLFAEPPAPALAPHVDAPERKNIQPHRQQWREAHRELPSEVLGKVLATSDLKELQELRADLRAVTHEIRYQLANDTTLTKAQKAQLRDSRSEMSDAFRAVKQEVSKRHMQGYFTDRKPLTKTLADAGREAKDVLKTGEKIAAKTVEKIPSRALGKGMELGAKLIGGFFEGLVESISPTQWTPEQLQARQENVEARAEERKFDLKKWREDEDYRHRVTAEHERLQQEREREDYRQRSRER